MSNWNIFLFRFKLIETNQLSCLNFSCIVAWVGLHWLCHRRYAIYLVPYNLQSTYIITHIRKLYHFQHMPNIWEEISEGIPTFYEANM